MFPFKAAYLTACEGGEWEPTGGWFSGRLFTVDASYRQCFSSACNDVHTLSSLPVLSRVLWQISVCLYPADQTVLLRRPDYLHVIPRVRFIGTNLQTLTVVHASLTLYCTVHDRSHHLTSIYTIFVSISPINNSHALVQLHEPPTFVSI